VVYWSCMSPVCFTMTTTPSLFRVVLTRNAVLAVLANTLLDVQLYANTRWGCCRSRLCRLSSPACACDNHPQVRLPRDAKKHQYKHVKERSAMQPITQFRPHESASRGALWGWKLGQRCSAFLVKREPVNRRSVHRSELLRPYLIPP
jgi:hypothetical protein